jgi:hypothetical protein
MRKPFRSRLGPKAGKLGLRLRSYGEVVKVIEDEEESGVITLVIKAKTSRHANAILRYKVGDIFVGKSVFEGLSPFTGLFFSQRTNDIGASEGHVLEDVGVIMRSFEFPEPFKEEALQLWSQHEANMIFQNPEQFWDWLNTPNYALSGNSPLVFIKSEPERITDLLVRLLHGVLA